MIYKVRVTTGGTKKEPLMTKEMLTTADSHAKLYSRLKDQYRVEKNEVTILEEIDEESIDINARSGRGKQNERKAENIVGVSEKDTNRKTRNKG